MRNLNRTLLALGLVIGAMLLAVPAAHADRVGKRIEAKIKSAMEEYDMMEFEAAKSQLLEAISIGEKNDSRGPELANAYLNLGVVYFSGLGQEDSASEAFGNALAINADVTIGVGYSTPEMAALLNAAKGQSSTAGDACSGDTLEHTLVDEAALGSSPEISATLGGSVKAAGVAMFYRPEGQLEFTKVPMKRSGECMYTGNIPSPAVQGEFVHYYVAALDKSGKEIERKGSSGSPNIIEVAAASGGSLSASEENPLGVNGGGSVLAKKSSTIFVSMAIGSGTGYINGPTEKTESAVECCFAPALLHLMPEVGYYISSQLSVSAAFRMGFPIGANVEGHATFAPAGLLRARYALSESGEGLMVSGALGGGVIRNTVEIKDAMDGNNTDTTAMGPLLFGGGVGYSKSLGGPMRLIAELNALAALTAGFDELGPCPGDGCVNPKNGAQFDANIAVLFAF